jgi:hypothetical protein
MSGNWVRAKTETGRSQLSQSESSNFPEIESRLRPAISMDGNLDELENFS